MLRALSAFHFEGQTVQLFLTSRRDALKVFRTCAYSGVAGKQTVLSAPSAGPATPAASPEAPPQGPPPAYGASPPKGLGAPPRSNRALTAAAITALTASLAGVYLYRKLEAPSLDTPTPPPAPPARPSPAPPPSRTPAHACDLPERVQYLIIGAGTAAFAAMRAIRSADPTSQVLMIGDEEWLPYMRPPLSKEIWREASPGAALDSERGTFRQWNGKRRRLVYEPEEFYAPVGRVGARGPGAARGWRVSDLDVRARTATVRPAGGGVEGEERVIHYDKCLIATGARARMPSALAAAAAAGRALTLRGVADAAALAASLEAVGGGAAGGVAVLGDSLLATELSAALQARLDETGGRVLQLLRAEPLERLLPRYLRRDVARRLRKRGVTLVREEVVSSELTPGGVELTLSSGDTLAATLVVACVGSEPNDLLATRAGLEVHPRLRGIVVNQELQAATDVWAAGDVACYYSVRGGRQRTEHHDHAVASGRRAGQNMVAGVGQRETGARPEPYDHLPMFWSDIGPDFGYEAIGEIDSSLKTVGVFCEDAVKGVTAVTSAARGGASAEGGGARAEGAESEEKGAESEPAFERGVVFYLRGRRVVGVLLWNLFNRLHVARQVLQQGEVEDLFEVAKLFTLHDDD